MFRDIIAPYHALESWFYDRAVAPAIAEILEERSDLLGTILGVMPAYDRLLYVGCGGGQLALTLADDHPGWGITGLDLSRDQVRRAMKRGKMLAGQLHFLTGSALALPFESDIFDGLISVCSIKHWPEPARGLEECLRVLRPGSPMVVLEVDPDYDRVDGRAFVARQHVPFILKPVAMAGFSWKIAARSMSVKHVESLFRSLPFSDVTAKPVPGIPLWIISARKERPCIPSKADQP